jgi:hypothetical protein
LFKDQALKPYKWALSGVAAALLLCIAGFIWYAQWAQKNMQALSEKNVASTEEINKIKLTNDSSSRVIGALQKKVKLLANRKPIIIRPQSSPSTTLESNDITLKNLYPSVYYIVAKNIEIEFNGEKKTREGDWSGTGFLMEDGRFVTARHVIEPWSFIEKNSEEEEPFFLENLVASNGGKIQVNFAAFSSGGGELNFTSTDFTFDKSGDKQYVHKSSTGDLLITKAFYSDDWASMKVSTFNGLKNGAREASALQPGNKLINLGFPFGMGVDKNSVEPIYGECVVSRSGIHGGYISISGRSFDRGNSGGPVLKKTGNGYSVIGLVSAGLGTQGIIIPISKVR